LREFFSAITGRIILIEETQDALELTIDENSTNYEIVYETEAPISTESNDITRKRIIVSGPDNLNYTNVLAYSFLSRETTENRIRMYWIQGNESLEVNLTKYDKNNNSLIDYVEWRVPKLSNQTYELIIEISWAEHLNSNREFISNITEDVNVLDGNWSEPINDGEFVRASFEQELDNTRDITVYPRGNATSIEVYEVNQTEVIATFTNITENSYNKVFLTNLEGVQDTFDLKILGGYLEFDHIVDPQAN